MDDLLLPESDDMQAAAARELRTCNALTERYGLELSEEQIQNIMRRRREALKNTGRVEFGSGIAHKLIQSFCDSPYLMQDDYEQIVSELQEIFYFLKNESEDRISDDDLIEWMTKGFNGKAHGSLTYLTDIVLKELSGESETEEEENLYDPDFEEL